MKCESNGAIRNGVWGLVVVVFDEVKSLDYFEKVGALKVIEEVVGKKSKSGPREKVALVTISSHV